MGFRNIIFPDSMGIVSTTNDDPQKYFEAIKNAPSIFDQPEDEDGQKELLKIIEEKGEELGKGEPEEDEEESEESEETDNTLSNLEQPVQSDKP